LRGGGSGDQGKGTHPPKVSPDDKKEYDWSRGKGRERGDCPGGGEATPDIHQLQKKSKGNANTQSTGEAWEKLPGSVCVVGGRSAHQREREGRITSISKKRSGK